MDFATLVKQATSTLKVKTTSTTSALDISPSSYAQNTTPAPAHTQTSTGTGIPVPVPVPDPDPVAMATNSNTSNTNTNTPGSQPRASLTTLPQEILNQILTDVVSARPTPPPVSTSTSTSPSTSTPTSTSTSTPPLSTIRTRHPTLSLNHHLYNSTIFALNKLPDKAKDKLELDMLLLPTGSWIPNWTYFPSPSVTSIRELKINVRYAGGCTVHGSLAMCLGVISQGGDGEECVERGAWGEGRRYWAQEGFLKVLGNVLDKGKVVVGEGVRRRREKEEKEMKSRGKKVRKESKRRMARLGFDGLYRDNGDGKRRMRDECLVGGGGGGSGAGEEVKGLVVQKLVLDFRCEVPAEYVYRLEEARRERRWNRRWQPTPTMAKMRKVAEDMFGEIASATGLGSRYWIYEPDLHPYIDAILERVGRLEVQSNGVASPNMTDKLELYRMMRGSISLEACWAGKWVDNFGHWTDSRRRLVELRARSGWMERRVIEWQLEYLEFEKSNDRKKAVGLMGKGLNWRS